ncbi:hypothetical protein SISSUDRAFT_1060693 [Sistotremastrum suecicum HHB10207 ss-3]|uniref:Beta-xylosidase C-terminal Concanavalin A-like domain-containing protein n=1 Tax=Sistotremastrum suecicum HHB10207 ss-3 TaxID=1314776 RepID=A0A166EWY7_9AGAM|nr:hypothetical protein SISSUDRAFT_1060693 [Sistotremastrum suecicum HHB10207 ss-3]
MPSFTNPIIPGFNPDPSVVFHDGIFYLVTSSFLAFPAIPLYASTDLVNWKQIGNVVTRDSQLDLSKAAINLTGESSGVWAPTIRWHDGLFYVNVTCVDTNIPDWEDVSRFESYIWTCADPFTEEWSDPVRFDFPGFDTSLFWDTDGKAYVQGSQSYKTFALRQISQFEIDLKTGKSLSGPPKFLWEGTGGIFPEAPHIFLKDGYYYLLIAEGGTYLDHSARMARAKNIWGPYEAYEKNPVLTPPPRDEYVQTIGHADFVQDGTGNWWAVALGTRIGKGQESPMGRETYLIPGAWPAGEWPSFQQPVKITTETANLLPPKPLTKVSAFQHDGSLNEFTSSSNPSKFAPHWVFLRNAAYKNYILSTSSPSSITLVSTPLNLNAAANSPTFVGRRQTAVEFTASVVVKTPPPKTEAGFTVFLDGIRHAEIFIVDGSVNFRTVEMGVQGVTKDVASLTQNEPVEKLGKAVSVASGAESVKFSVKGTESEFVFSYDGQEFGKINAREVSVGFCGTIIGVYAVGESTKADFADFTYTE